MDILEILKTHAETKGNRVFLKHEGVEYSFKRTFENVLKVAVYLKQEGICAEDRVAIILPNSPEFVFFYYGCAIAGVVSIPIDTRYRKKEIEIILNSCKPKIIVALKSYHGTDYTHLLGKIIAGIGSGIRTIFLDELDIIDKNVSSKSFQSFISLSKDNIPMTIMYTSGSTGEPKGAVLTQMNLITNAAAVNERLSISEKDVFLLMVPFSHAFGSSVLLNEALVAGASVVITDLFDPEHVLSIIATEKITLLYAVPTQVIQLIEAKKRLNIEVSSLRTGYISGAACTPELMKQIKSEFNCDACIAYGMTEASCISISDWKDSCDIRENSAGRPVRGMELKIVDDRGCDVHPGQPGEILIRGTSLMNEYFSGNALGDRWFDTGDIGTKDTNGSLMILGRKKETIIRGGFNIYPAEIERHLLLHEKIKFAAVVGVPDTFYGEKTAACIIPCDGEIILDDDIRAFCKKHLASYKVPDYIITYESMPFTVSRKIRKDILKIDVEKKIK